MPLVLTTVLEWINSYAMLRDPHPHYVPFPSRRTAHQKFASWVATSAYVWLLPERPEYGI